jgi:hypothetical protein
MSGLVGGGSISRGVEALGGALRLRSNGKMVRISRPVQSVLLASHTYSTHPNNCENNIRFQVRFSENVRASGTEFLSVHTHYHSDLYLTRQGAHS